MWARITADSVVTSIVVNTCEKVYLFISTFIPNVGIPIGSPLGSLFDELFMKKLMSCGSGGARSPSSKTFGMFHVFAPGRQHIQISKDSKLPRPLP